MLASVRGEHVNKTKKTTTAIKKNDNNKIQHITVYTSYLIIAKNQRRTR